MVMSDALELDEKVWPEEKRTLTGASNGSPYTITYTPKRDIAGHYGVSYEYGLLAGLDPNRALVWGLQALGAGLMSKAFLRRNLPVSLNVAEEEQVMDIEGLRDSLLSAVSAFAQAIPQMASQGQDASEPVRAIAGLIEARKKGTSIEKAVEELFPPPEPQQPAPADEMGQMPGPPGQPQMPGAPGGGVDIEEPQPEGMAQMLSQLSGNGRADTSIRQVRMAPL
jgi:hypothetical protein